MMESMQTDNVWADLGWEREEPPSPLHRAVAAGDVAQVERLLAAGADQNLPVDLYRPGVALGPEEDDWRYGSVRLQYTYVPPLTVVSMVSAAAPYGEQTKRRIATLLLDHGADVQHRGYSALDAAARHRDPTTLTLLLERGADIGWQGALGETILGEALGGWDGPPEDDTRVAGADRLEAVVTLLLDAGADPNEPIAWDCTWPLDIAIRGSAPLPVVRLLLARGADPDARTADGGNVALHTAAARGGIVPDSGEGGGDLSLLRLLVQAGADPDGADHEGYTVLMEVAGEWPDWDGADAALGAGWRPDEIAAQVRALLAAGASVDIAHPETGETALFEAVRAGNPLAVRALLAAGADAGHLNAAGASAYLVARDELCPEVAGHRAEVMRLLESVGAHQVPPPEAACRDLRLALRWGQSTSALRLVAAEGADPNEPDEQGYTPLHAAAMFGAEPEVVRALLECCFIRENYHCDAYQQPSSTLVATRTIPFLRSAFCGLWRANHNENRGWRPPPVETRCGLTQSSLCR
jgi:ankyrin repeat protein